MSNLNAITTAGTEIVLEEAAIEALKGGLRGELLRDGDPGYDEARVIWNGMIDKKPALMARCRGTADVIDAVNFACERDLLLSVRGGGHNVAGNAICDRGMMIDLSLMCAVRVDPNNRRAWVQGGATWGDVDRETQVFGLATPGGLISDTGVAGLTLAGGIGWMRGKHGLCIDNVRSVEIVTADGQCLSTSDTENSDLFWAVRGGGGNFGIVTSFEFELYPLGPTVMFCAPIYAAKDSPKVIRAWRDFLTTAPEALSGLVEFSTVAEGDPEFPKEAWGLRVIAVAMLYDGPADEGEKAIRPLRELGSMVTDFSGQMNYCAVQSLFDTLMPRGEYHAYWKSLYLKQLNDEAIDAVCERASNPPSPKTLCSIWNFGGATSRVPADSTAFGDRSMPFMLSIDSTWKDPADSHTNIEWTRKFWSDMKQYGHGGLYLNFPGFGEEGEELVRAAYGKNYERLVTLKNKYDPNNLFRMNQNIRPAP